MLYSRNLSCINTNLFTNFSVPLNSKNEIFKTIWKIGRIEMVNEWSLSTKSKSNCLSLNKNQSQKYIDLLLSIMYVLWSTWIT